MGMTSFREVLEKMLVIVVLPVRKSLRKEVELFSPHLVSNTCGLLASIVSELTASALGSEVASIEPTPVVSCPESRKYDLPCCEYRSLFSQLGFLQRCRFCLLRLLNS